MQSRKSAFILRYLNAKIDKGYHIILYFFNNLFTSKKDSISEYSVVYKFAYLEVL